MTGWTSIFTDVPRVDYEKLTDDRLSEASSRVQTRVAATRKQQQERFHGTRLTCNAEMTPNEVREYCQVEEAAQGLLKAAMERLNLSARAFHRILKLARTIADMEVAKSSAPPTWPRLSSTAPGALSCRQYIMDEYLRKNRELWNKLTPIHARSDFYDVETFKQGRCALKSIELKELGDVFGKSMLHLQCHFGLDSLSWARRGARVTGVDFSDEAITQARSLSRETGI